MSSQEGNPFTHADEPALDADVENRPPDADARDGSDFAPESPADPFTEPAERHLTAPEGLLEVISEAPAAPSTELLVDPEDADAPALASEESDPLIENAFVGDVADDAADCDGAIGDNEEDEPAPFASIEPQPPQEVVAEAAEQSADDFAVPALEIAVPNAIEVADSNVDDENENYDDTSDRPADQLVAAAEPPRAEGVPLPELKPTARRWFNIFTREPKPERPDADATPEPTLAADVSAAVTRPVQSTTAEFNSDSAEANDANEHVAAEAFDRADDEEPAPEAEDEAAASDSLAEAEAADDADTTADAADAADTIDPAGSSLDTDQPDPPAANDWQDEESDTDDTVAAVGSGGFWTIPLLCLGIGVIACCLIIPQVDANRRLAYQRSELRRDLEQVQAQVATNNDFLRKLAGDPQLAERLAQRQMKMVRAGTKLLPMGQGDAGTSPFDLVQVSPPPPMEPYLPIGGQVAELCYSPRMRLYLMGGGLFLMAAGLVLGVAGPDRRLTVEPPQSRDGDSVGP